MAVVVVLLALAVLVGATAVLARPRSGVPGNAATALLPPAGHREVVVDDTGHTIREYALSTGGPMLTSGPVGLLFAAQDVEAFMNSHWLRLLETRVEGQTTTHTTVALDVTDRGITRRLDVTGDVVGLWEPAPVLLPATIADGTRWRTSGSVHRINIQTQDLETTTYDFHAEVSVPGSETVHPPGCLDVHRTERIDTDETSRSETWCPGRGIVASEGTSTSAPPAPVPAHDQEHDWDPASWEMTSTDLAASPPLAWGTMLPVAGSEDVLVLAHDPTGDVIFVPDDDPGRAVRAHPGGRTTTLTSFGDLVVVTTTTAAVSTYDTSGRWLWEARLPDVVVHPPTMVDGALVLADGSGRVTALDAATGQGRWSTSLADQVISPPVACGEVVAVGTTAGEVVLLDVDGAVFATAGFEERPTELACGTSGDIVAAAGSRLERLSGEGRHLASAPLRDATTTALLAADGVVITHSSAALTAWDATTLERLWRIDHGFADAIIGDGHVVVVDEERIVAIDLAGQEVASWEAAVHAEGVTTHLVAHPGGISVLGHDSVLVRLR